MIGTFYYLFCALWRPTGVSQAHLSLCHQVFSRHHYITEPSECIKLRAALGKSSVAHFVVTEDSFDVEKAVLDFPMHACFRSLQFCPRNKLIHFVQKDLLVGFLFLDGKLSFGKGQLAHNWLLLVGSCNM